MYLKLQVSSHPGGVRLRLQFRPRVHLVYFGQLYEFFGVLGSLGELTNHVELLTWFSVGAKFQFHCGSPTSFGLHKQHV